MKTVNLDINFTEYSSIEEMSPTDQALVREAIEAQKGSYAPYSNFNVGAALLLDDGTVVFAGDLEFLDDRLHGVFRMNEVFGDDREFFDGMVIKGLVEHYATDVVKQDMAAKSTVFVDHRKDVTT